MKTLAASQSGIRTVVFSSQTRKARGQALRQ
jgi:hypothetical protein